MAGYFCISITYLDGRFHGRGDGGEPEWPPSPLRLLQAIVAANGDEIGSGGALDGALEWLEQQDAPVIIAPTRQEGAAYSLSVPNNAMDLVAKAWSRGNYFGSGDANPATHRTMKTVRPVHLRGGDTVHYAWTLSASKPPAVEQIQVLTEAASRVAALGWGIDLVVGRAARISASELRELEGEAWRPSPSRNLNALRIPTRGTLAALRRRHEQFLRRIGEEGFAPVEPLMRFNVIGYRRATDPIGRPFAVFELRHDDGLFCTYSQRKLIHITGMVRHLAGELMQTSPPSAVDEDWVERYILGHRKEFDPEHRQLSYLPLPSVGHEHADQLVRRVMIAAPVGDDRWLEHLAHRLVGQQLRPERGDEFGDKGAPTLVRVYRDKVARRFTDPAIAWASITPVILPGHDDRDPNKTRKLLEKALAHSGIEQRCEFEWSPFSRFRKSLTAHKYDRSGQPAGYIRPDHLLSQTAVHLKLRFKGGIKVPGPLAIGAGRHCGLGVFAAAE